MNLGSSFEGESERNTPRGHNTKAEVGSDCSDWEHPYYYYGVGRDERRLRGEALAEPRRVTHLGELVGSTTLADGHVTARAGPLGARGESVLAQGRLHEGAIGLAAWLAREAELVATGAGRRRAERVGPTDGVGRRPRLDASTPCEYGAVFFDVAGDAGYPEGLHLGPDRERGGLGGVAGRTERCGLDRERVAEGLVLERAVVP